MKKLIAIACMLLSVGIPASLTAGVKESIQAENKAGRSVFLVVIDNATSSTDIAGATKSARDAVKLVPKASVLTLNRSDATNAELVAKYRLTGAPVPLILVVASNGTLTGGLIARYATPEKLAELVPSPRKAVVLQVVEQGKGVFLVVGRKSMTDKSAVVTSCTQACSALHGGADVLELNLDDKAEQRFLAELKVDPSATQTQTVVINNRGQITGTLTGNVTSTLLVATVNKKPSSGCCPSGSGATCPPVKK
jgi:hypothetical protein